MECIIHWYRCISLYHSYRIWVSKAAQVCIVCYLFANVYYFLLFLVTCWLLLFLIKTYKPQHLSEWALLSRCSCCTIEVENSPTDTLWFNIILHSDEWPLYRSCLRAVVLFRICYLYKLIIGNALRWPRCCLFCKNGNCVQWVWV